MIITNRLALCHRIVATFMTCLTIFFHVDHDPNAIDLGSFVFAVFQLSFV